MEVVGPCNVDCILDWTNSQSWFKSEWSGNNHAIGGVCLVDAPFQVLHLNCSGVLDLGLRTTLLVQPNCCPLPGDCRGHVTAVSQLLWFPPQEAKQHPLALGHLVRHPPKGCSAPTEGALTAVVVSTGMLWGEVKLLLC